MSNPEWVFPDDTGEKITCIEWNDKNSIARLLVQNMLQKTNSMFEWKGLPNTVPQDYLEALLQYNGQAAIIKKDDKYFAVMGTVGGMRNYNYRPTILIVSNPYLLKQSETYVIYYGEDTWVEPPTDTLPNVNEKTEKCVLIRNDSMMQGLVPLSNFYASQLVENIITKRRVVIGSRMMYLIAAATQDIKDDFDDVMQALEEGEVKAILAEEFLSNGVATQVATLPLADKQHDAITHLIEDQQYIKASWLNDFGLQANYNMKRESINSNESQLNKDAILPFVDNMLARRKEACKLLNELYGLNVSVDYSSAWGYTRTTIEQAIDAIDPNSETKVGEEDEVDTATQVAKDGEEVEKDSEDNSET